jgi:hypothetical protein
VHFLSGFGGTYNNLPAAQQEAAKQQEAARKKKARKEAYLKAKEEDTGVLMSPGDMKLAKHMGLSVAEFRTLSLSSTRLSGRLIAALPVAMARKGTLISFLAKNLQEAVRVQYLNTSAKQIAQTTKPIKKLARNASFSPEVERALMKLLQISTGELRRVKHNRDAQYVKDILDIKSMLPPRTMYARRAAMAAFSHEDVAERNRFFANLLAKENNEVVKEVETILQEVNPVVPVPALVPTIDEEIDTTLYAEPMVEYPAVTDTDDQARWTPEELELMNRMPPATTNQGMPRRPAVIEPGDTDDAGEPIIPTGNPVVDLLKLLEGSAKARAKYIKEMEGKDIPPTIQTILDKYKDADKTVKLKKWGLWTLGGAIGIAVLLKLRKG